MQNAHGMRLVQCRQDLLQDVHDALEAQGSTHELRKVLASEQLHDQVHASVLEYAEVVDVDGVRVVDLRRQARFPHEA